MKSWCSGLVDVIVRAYAAECTWHLAIESFLFLSVLHLHLLLCRFHVKLSESNGKRRTASPRIKTPSPLTLFPLLLLTLVKRKIIGLEVLAMSYYAGGHCTF
ncbi:Uncharacterized protein Rs2_37946 [Raphanus sativus]|nr:Uncharacterized protein Rs2_37946 [Raphanus sativus]